MASVLGKFSFSSFLKFMEASRRKNESVKRSPKLSRATTSARPFPRKRPTVVAVEKDQVYVGKGVISCLFTHPIQREESYCVTQVVGEGLDHPVIICKSSPHVGIQERSKLFPLSSQEGTRPRPMHYVQKDLEQEAPVRMKVSQCS